MSTHAHTSDIQHAAPITQGPDGHTAPAHTRKAGVPILLLVAFGLVLVIGLALIFGRARLDENATFDAMNNSEAAIKHVLHERDENKEYVKVFPNGLAEDYGLVRINKERESIAAYISLCDRTDPVVGLRLYRRAFSEGSKSAKLVAISCANYLAHSQTTPAPQTEKGVLEASDFKLLLDSMDLKKEPDLDIRKAALHAVSDLIVIVNPAAISALTADPKSETRYTKISDEMMKAAKDNLDVDTSKEDASKEKKYFDRRRDIKIALHKDLVNTTPVLLVRWSSPSLGLAWWNEFGKEGKWDQGMQRFVFP